MLKPSFALAASLLVASSAAATSEHESCPMHAQHMAEKSGEAHSVDARHDAVAPAHDVTKHRFRLYSDGGAIELHALSPDDRATISEVRSHLREIQTAFENRDFSTPRFVHGKVPDGVESMARLHSQISYRFEELPDGAKIDIVTRGDAARAAVHDFMRFQIDEHRTGDKAEIEKR